LNTATWAQTPLVVRQCVLQLLDVSQQQQERITMLEARIAALEARLQQTSRTSDRPPSSDPPDAKRPASPGAKRTPGARPRHTGHR
jgi:uncharacterized small protein (DUF1192 family)